MPVPYGALPDAVNGDLLFDVADGIARITLNRPSRGNSFTVAMFPQFRTVWEEVRTNDDIRCVIITGAGDRHFCTGVDVDSVAAAGKVAMGSGNITDELHFTSRQTRVWKPVICAVNGLAAGGGLHFVVDSDIVVAVEHAAFLDSHVNVGQVGGIENTGLARRLPLGTALRMTLQGRNYRLSAARAYQLGLVDELTAPERLMETALQIARDIAANSPQAVSLSQQAVWASTEMPYSQAAEYGWSLVRSHWSHPDFVEGPQAFAERRPPRWTVG
ncbi:enoyl-CoA hydratase/isomerase family protein [Acrocarpospora catenulata]|uniref:enoyl-CoA hydratase/isomerase family protein n=1 Tax=Acrocarpospora catenulata TaxID=2836182 RepID=UPI001BD9CD19|nr:enoyl-CoA hydratase/isomerase family protein [Acrocarpospora catenulata]